MVETAGRGQDHEHEGRRSTRTHPREQAAGVGAGPGLCPDLALLWPVLLYGPGPPLLLQVSEALFCDPTTDGPWGSKGPKLTAKPNAQTLLCERPLSKHPSFQGSLSLPPAWCPLGSEKVF